MTVEGDKISDSKMGGLAPYSTQANVVPDKCRYENTRGTYYMDLLYKK